MYNKFYGNVTMLHDTTDKEEIWVNLMGIIKF